jgi:hypothetical protein
MKVRLTEIVMGVTTILLLATGEKGMAGTQQKITVSNGQIQVVAEFTDGHYACLQFGFRLNSHWHLIALWQPIMHIVYDGQQGEVNWQPVLAHGRVKGTTMDFSDQLADPDGGRWQVRLTISLDRNEPVAKIRCEWRCSSDRRVKALWGPNLFVGESDAKLGAYCPALNSFTMANLLPTHEISPHHFTTEELPTRES